MTPRPSKRAVMEALSDVFVETNWEYREHGPDRLGWRHAMVVISLSGGREVRLHANENASVYTLRRRMIEACESFHGGPRL